MRKIFILNLLLFLAVLNTSCAKNDYEKYMKIQNEKNDVLYGETLYPEQIKSQIDIYNHKYNLNIQYASNKKEFNNFVKTLRLTEKPVAIFQYNEGHKYGFIFVKYNGQDYVLCIDTIPTLSEYTKNLKLEKDNNLYIKFNNREFRVVMFGENLQKAMKGCGSFTLVFLKHLLKNNAKMLFDILKLEKEYGTGDKTKRDKNKKSCIRGVDFDIIKKQDFAKDIYKYAQSMELQKNFDNTVFEKNNIKYSQYRNEFSIIKKNKNNQDVQVSTKIFDITQKYKFSPIFLKQYKKQNDIKNVKQKYETEIDFYKNGDYIITLNQYLPSLIEGIPKKGIITTTDVSEKDKTGLQDMRTFYH